MPSFSGELSNMRRLSLCTFMAIGFAVSPTGLAAQEQQAPGKKAPDTKAPAKKAPPEKVVIQGVRFEVLTTSEDKVGAIQAPGGRLFRKWTEESMVTGNPNAKGGFWAVSSFTWTVNLPKETPPVRVLIPHILNGKVTVMADGREAWKVDRTGQLAKGNLSPVVAVPGDSPNGVTLVVQVDGQVSIVTLLVPAKDAPMATAAEKEKYASSKAAELLAKAKEALQAKSYGLAKIRLQLVVAEWGRTPQADEARALLKALEKQK